MRFSPPALLAFVFIFGCASGPEVYPKEMNVTGFDFTKYTEQGFLITPEKYEREYESIGMLNVTVYPRLEKISLEEPPAQPGAASPAKEWFVTKEVVAQEVVDSLYVEARSLGADAIINFRTDVVTQDLKQGVSRTGIQARGFAIDRESP
jgi:hypothetical protein